MTGEQYDSDYYLRGKDTGKSLYEDYRWLPNLTVPMACRIIAHCGIQPDHHILDFGAARGYTVKAMRDLGYRAFGVDASKWAVDNCHPDVVDYMQHNDTIPTSFDWIIAKDVLEHVPEVADTIDNMMFHAAIGVFAVVPLSITDGGPYNVGDYEKDVTHVHRLTLATWARMFTRHGWSVTLAYRVPGVKDNYSEYERGNGFLTCRRLV